MNDSENPPDPHEHGELFSSGLTFTWINPDPIDEGELIAPAMLSSPLARVFAAKHLILGDIQFALACFKNANELGLPDSKNLQSKALIFAGVVGYARCFKSSVRDVKLNAPELSAQVTRFDETIHEYLIALRDKHVAHSVNDCEDCQAIAVVIGRQGSTWRDGKGVGVVLKQTIGISRSQLRTSIDHIERLQDYLSRDLEHLRQSLYVEFATEFKKNGKWQPAPIVKLSDRSRIGERRK